MFTIWKLTIASIKMFVRNRQAIFFTFFTPLLIIVIFGAIGFDRVPTINVGVALQGSTNIQTQQFVEQLQKVPVFKLSYGSLNTERKALENGDRAIVLDLTSHPFGSTQNPQIPSDLRILRNVGDANSTTVISIIEQMLDKATIARSGITPLVNVSVEEVNAHNLKYIDFLLPGLIALSVMQLAVFSVAFVFVEYKERGILKRVLATPVRPYQFVTANIITRLLVSIIQAAFFIVVGVLFFGVSIIGSYIWILVAVILGAIMFLGLGFTVSGLSKTTESVPAIANLVVFPMLFLGGTFFPIDAMPTWLQYVSKALPLTYFSSALRDVMTKGAGILEIYPDLLIMIVWAIVLVGLAVLTFSLEEKRVG
jgi:ABC-2 type transport system permease protein